MMTSRKMRQLILLVDDDRDTRESMSELITDLGYSVTSCESGLAALNILQNKQFDLVLTDLQMPGMDGLTLLDKIKLNYRDVSVVIMTGYADMAIADKAMYKGATAYLNKPSTLDELHQTIKLALD